MGARLAREGALKNTTSQQQLLRFQHLQNNKHGSQHRYTLSAYPRLQKILSYFNALQPFPR